MPYGYQQIIDGARFISAQHGTSTTANTYTSLAVPTGTVYCEIFSDQPGYITLGSPTSTNAAKLFGVMQHQVFNIDGVLSVSILQEASGNYNALFYGVR